MRLQQTGMDRPQRLTGVAPRESPKSILLLGATGLFGGHLASQLSARDDVTLTVAGRTLTKLAPLAAELDAVPLMLDRSNISAVQVELEKHRPFAVIDCSGPFQNYGAKPYAFAEATLRSGAHYLDIADGPEFVKGITELDALAKELNLCAWSGASTTPALSSAIAADLSAQLDSIDLVETFILPGNKTRRGLSVMQAILGQVGKPFQHVRGHRKETTYGWADSVRIALKVGQTSLKPRLAARVNTPDISLLPIRFGSATVSARAGLELPLFHCALSIARHIIPALGITSFERLAKPLLHLSNAFLGFGSDAGGMRVRVRGTKNNTMEERVWDMIIPDGEGPKTPVQPVLILLNQLLNGSSIAGAKSAVTAFTRNEAETQLATIGAIFERRDRVLTSIFEQALSAGGSTAFTTLAAPVQALHRVPHLARFKGSAEVITASTLIARLAAVIGRFPLHESGCVPAQVEILADGQTETWTRKRGSKVFRSVLRYDPMAGVTEQFGPLTFGLDLHVQHNRLQFPITTGRLFGFIPIPGPLVPISKTSESMDDNGRFHFDVQISLPSGALIVHYKGHLFVK